MVGVHFNRACINGNCFYPPTREPGSVMVEAPQGWTDVLQKVSAIGLIVTVFLWPMCAFLGKPAGSLHRDADAALRGGLAARSSTIRLEPGRGSRNRDIRRSIAVSVSARRRPSATQSGCRLPSSFCLVPSRNLLHRHLCYQHVREALPPSPGRFPPRRATLTASDGRRVHSDFNEACDVLIRHRHGLHATGLPEGKAEHVHLDDGGTAQKLEQPDPPARSGRPEAGDSLKSIASRLGVNYFARETDRYAKAGNINEGLLGNFAPRDDGNDGGRGPLRRRGFRPQLR